jgi:hypothetical protein
MQYAINPLGGVILTADNGAVTYIAADPNNADYQAYLAWVAAGNTATPVTAPTLAQVTAQLAAQIDSLVAFIYSNWARFQAEYDARLAAAQAFAAANYAGDPGPWVDAYATAAGITQTVAAQNIIAQGAALDSALQTLGGLRMQKYGILSAATVEAANAAYASLVAQIEAEAAQIT